MAEHFKKTYPIFSFIFLLTFLFGVLNRTGSLILIWKEEPLGSITHDSGNGYYAFIRDENISKLKLPFFLKEDDSILFQKPLSVNEDITASIKDTGGGSYQLRGNNDLYFSASDNQPETHEYSIISPVIIRNRYLLILLISAFAAAFFPVYQFLKNKSRTIKNILQWITTVCFLLLLLPWDINVFHSSPFQIGKLLVLPLLQRNMILICLFFIILLLNVLLAVKPQTHRFLAAAVVIINTCYYFVPEWNYFGQRADTPAYLEHYTASSIRTPGYPVFIEGIYRLTGDDSLQTLRNSSEIVTDESLQDSRNTESLGLINAARGQKIVLGISFLILFFVFCFYYPPIWFAFSAQIILSGGFLGVDNSYIMTECLSQSVCLLITALFILTMKEKHTLLFVLLCVLSGYGMLIRPANLFLVIPIGISAIHLFISKRSNILPIFAGLLAFLVITAIPSVTIYREYKTFVWMPTSGYVEIARAVELLQPGDEESFTDPELAAFTKDLLLKKQLIGEADQNTYMWQVGIATAQEHGYDLINCSPILGKVSRKIFSLHSSEFVQTLSGTMKTALERTRLQIGPVSFPMIALLFIVLFFINIQTDSLIGMTLVLMHIAHLFIFITNQPERRYIYSTEILCILGFLLIFISLFKKYRSE